MSTELAAPNFPAGTQRFDLARPNDSGGRVGETVAKERLQLDAFSVNGNDVGEMRNVKIKSACVKVPEGRGRGDMSGE